MDCGRLRVQPRAARRHLPAGVRGRAAPRCRVQAAEQMKPTLRPRAHVPLCAPGAGDTVVSKAGMALTSGAQSPRHEAAV